MHNSALEGRKPLLLAVVVAGLFWGLAALEIWSHSSGAGASAFDLFGASGGAGGSLWLMLLVVIGLLVPLLVFAGYAHLWRIIRQNAVQIELQRRIIEQTSEAMMVVDNERRILAVNPAFERITGYAADDVIGQLPNVLASPTHGFEAYDAGWHAAAVNGTWVGELWGRRKTGELFPKSCRIRAVDYRAENTSHFVAVFTDIAGQKAQEARIEFLVQHDPLTGLPNRLALEDHLDAAIALAGGTAEHLALMIIDLDDFKTINDSLGHHAGDRLLALVAERIQAQLPEQAHLFRLGGDEFAVVLEPARSGEEVLALVRKISAAIAEPCEIAERCLHVSPSLGVSCFPKDGSDAQTLIRSADTAMYAAKAAGRNGYQFFADRMGAEVNQRLRLESELWQALAGNQLVLHYQPQFDLLTGKMVGVEALIRWQHPLRGLIGPTEFVSVAEECGLILPLGQWVLRNACRQAKAWLDEGRDIGEIAVNISPQQFRQPDFAQTVRAALDESGLPAQRLELEITESTVMHGVEEAVAMFYELKAMGVRLAIDDFGTGYSSLSYLRQFPLNRLKIDRAFVADIEKDPDAAALVSSIVALGRSLGLELVAEGIENEAQADYLRILECDRGQGFLFRRPVSAEQIFPPQG